jgi:hypothetical protein
MFEYIRLVAVNVGCGGESDLTMKEEKLDFEGEFSFI